MGTLPLFLYLLENSGLIPIAVEFKSKVDYLLIEVVNLRLLYLYLLELIQISNEVSQNKTSWLIEILLIVYYFAEDDFYAAAAERLHLDVAFYMQKSLDCADYLSSYTLDRGFILVAVSK